MSNISLILALSLTIGIAAQLLARVLRIPGIVVLLTLGVLLGQDGVGLIVTSHLGGFLQELVSSSVAIVLFEGALGLSIKQLRRESKVITRLISSGALFTALGGTLAARFFLDWDWHICLLFGSLVVVTGPTVIAPLLRRVIVKKNVRMILNAEAVLIDPIGAIFALVVLEVIVSTSDAGVIHGLTSFIYRFGFGALTGIASGYLIGFLLKAERLVPEEYANIFTLAAVLLVFHGCNGIIHESGIMAVTVAGVVIGNMRVPAHKELADFKEQITVMLVGMLFVILAADMRIATIRELGIGGVYLILTLMFVVRPLEVFWCARGSKLKWNEKAFISWLSPRGIVAAAVASLFATSLAKEGLTGGDDLRAAVFAVIGSTVVIQGLLAGPVARLLKVRVDFDGYLFIGANAVCRTMAMVLSKQEEDVVIVDRTEGNCLQAEKLGMPVIMGDAMSTGILRRGQIESRRYVIAGTPNDTLNMMILRKCRSLAKSGSAYTANSSQKFSVTELRAAKATELFGGRFDVAYWSKVTEANEVFLIHADVENKEMFKTAVDEKVFQSAPFQLLPLFAVIKGKTLPYSSEVTHSDCEGFYFLIYTPAYEDITKKLAAAGLGSFTKESYT